MSRRPEQPRAELANLERYVIPTVRNASQMMKLLAQSSDGYRLSDLSRALCVPVTTTLRIMATLQLEGLVRRVGRRFKLVLAPAAAAAPFPSNGAAPSLALSANHPVAVAQVSTAHDDLISPGGSRSP